MLKLRYGIDATSAPGIVMVAYTLMLSVTSTIAYATIFNVLFDTDRTLSVIIGGAIVMLYSSIGGMWSITLTDMVQFILKTIGVFFLLLPVHLEQRGRPRRHPGACRRHVFDLGAIGDRPRSSRSSSSTRFGMLIGQDIWQRVFTARSPQVAKWGGTTAGDLLPALRRRRRADRHRRVDIPARRRGEGRRLRARSPQTILPVGISGIVLAAAVAAMMSTASGALIATATVARADVMPFAASGFRTQHGEHDEPNPEHDVHSDRLYVVVLGIAVIVIAALLNDVVAALTIAYDILVGGLLVPILGGFVWKRATGAGALWSMAVGHGRHAGHDVRRVGGVARERADLLRPRREPHRLRGRQPADAPHARQRCCRCGTTGWPEATPPRSKRSTRLRGPEHSCYTSCHEHACRSDPLDGCDRSSGARHVGRGVAERAAGGCDRAHRTHRSGPQRGRDPLVRPRPEDRRKHRSSQRSVPRRAVPHQGSLRRRTRGSGSATATSRSRRRTSSPTPTRHSSAATVRLGW